VTTIGLFSFSKYTKTQHTVLQQKTIISDLLYSRTLAQTTGKDSIINFHATGYSLQSGSFTKEISLYPGYTASPQQLGYTPKGTPKYSRTIILYYQEKPVSKLTIAIGSGILRWQNL
jgi:hypothetical protein